MHNEYRPPIRIKHKKMNFKFTFLVLASSFFMNELQAQATIKIGYISIQELVSAMPEFKKAATDLEEYEKALILQGQDNQAEFMRQDSIFKTDSTTWNDEKKEIKRNELKTISIKMIGFNQEAQQLMTKKEQDLVVPIQQKALETTRMVARENGYSYVLGKEQLIAFPETDNMLPLVLKKLGIVPPPKQ